LIYSSYLGQEPHIVFISKTLATTTIMAASTKSHLTGLIVFFLVLGDSTYGQHTMNPKLEFDHILLFVHNHSLKDSLDEIFTPAEKLTTQHKNQGTIGYYYLFYNTYVELLFLQDSIHAQRNVENFGSDYVSRWSQNQRYCPIGFGMLMSPWDTNTQNIHFHKYPNRDSPGNEYYLMSEYNHDLSKPFIYISQPHRAYKSLETLHEIDHRPEEIREDLRSYLTHKNQVRRISRIIYSYSTESHSEGNLKFLKENPMIVVSKSGSDSLTLEFDNGQNGQKAFMLNDHTTLIIKY
jgi:hypothetical protein